MYLSYRDKLLCTVVLVVLASFGIIGVAFASDIMSGREILDSHESRIVISPFNMYEPSCSVDRDTLRYARSELYQLRSSHKQVSRVVYDTLSQLEVLRR